jgi:hypothetical protein
MNHIRLRWPRGWTLVGLGLAVAASGALLTYPSTTRQGIDFAVTEHRIPLYVKALAFMHRHHQHRLLAARICEGKTSDLERVMAVFDWTHRNIRPTPEGWPIVDDHVIDIAIRGHGLSDQMADLFATLSVYAGVPAFFRVLGDPGHSRLVVAFALIDGRWVPFDVQRHLVFRNRRGSLASVDDLLDDPALVEEQAQGIRIGDEEYSTLVSRRTLSPFVIPGTLRATLHQPWPRMRYELRRLFASGG